MSDSSVYAINKTAILFGNIDDKGQLEADDKDLVELNKLGNCQLTELNEKIETLLESNDENPEECIKVPDNIIPKDYYEETEVIDESMLGDMVDTDKLNRQALNAEDNYDDDDDDECVIVDDSSVKMPPPSQPPSSQSKLSNIRVATSNTADSFINLENQLDRLNGGNNENNTPDSYLFQNDCNSSLNTPLGRILPPEYANIDITTLFPHYSSDKIPRWSKLFKPFHQPQLYKPLDALKANKPTTENGLINNNKDNDKAPNYVYDEHGINLGEVAPPEMILPNDADLLREPAKTFADYEVPVPYKDMRVDSLSQSYVTYNNIATVDNQTNDQSISNITNNNSSNTKNNNGYKTNSAFINSVHGHSSYQRRMKIQQESIAARKKRKREEKNKKEEQVKKDELLIGLSWRDGPAKYWYDLFEIPASANILEYKIETNLNMDDTDILPRITIDSDDEECNLQSWQLYPWENEIIVDPSNHKKEVLETNRKHAPYAGWIPSYKHRNMATYQDAFSVEFFGIWPSSSMGTTIQRPNPTQWRSIFAPENLDILTEDWASQIITDPRQPHAQKPFLLELDLNNEHIHFDFTNSNQSIEILTSELNDITMNKVGTGGVGALAGCSTMQNASITGGLFGSMNGSDNTNGSSIITPPGFSNIAGASANAATSTTLSGTLQNDETGDGMNETNTAGNNTDTPNKDDKQIKKMKILSKFNADNNANNNATDTDDKQKEEKIEEIFDETFKLLTFSSRDTYQPLQEPKSGMHLFNMEPQDLPTNQTGDSSNSQQQATLQNTTTAQSNNNMNPLAAINAFSATGGGVNSSTVTTIDMVTNPDLAAPLVTNGILHSLPAIKLDPTLFPLKIDNQFLRTFHRPRLTDFKELIPHLLAVPLPIANLQPTIHAEDEQRQRIRQITGNGDVFFMRCTNDLSSTFDHIIFAEYSEEYPPLVKQVGMTSRIVNYYCSSPKYIPIMPELKYGELMVTPQIPFLGQISPHQVFSVFENNMFRAPIYPHHVRSTDFLVTMKTNSLHVRRVDDIFTVGQQLPLVEVPSPNSKKANSFLKDFLQVQFIRLFLQCEGEPKKVRHDELKVMFNEQSDSALKKRLKAYADYRKADTGSSGGYWVLKPEFQLPSEDELLASITPEDCCAYYSMMWGLCRLEDAGYNSRTLSQGDNEEDEEEKDQNNLKIEEEVKAAPWHTTKAFLDAQKSKCFLELNGSTDPTGIGEGYSYSRVSTKASLFKESVRAKAGTSASLLTGNINTGPGGGTGFGGIGISGSNAGNNASSGGRLSTDSSNCLGSFLGSNLARESSNSNLAGSAALSNVNCNNPGGQTTGTLVPGFGKRMVTGTDADLRKLTLKEAHALLLKNGISNDYIKKLKRWDIIDLVREMSTQKAKQGEEEGMTKFARSSRMTVADQEERYKQECQRIFDLQNRVLSNDDELTSDDGGSDDDEDGNANNNTMGANTNDKNSLVDDGNADNDIDVLKFKKSLDNAVAQKRNQEMSETNSLADAGDNSNGPVSRLPNQSQKPVHILPSSRESAKSVLKFKTKQIPKAVTIRRYIDSGDGSGTKVMQPQTIPWSYILKIYFKLNEEHSVEYLKDFCGLSLQSKEEEKKVRKKQQDQLRRIKKQQKQKMQQNQDGTTSANIKKKYKPKMLKNKTGGNLNKNNNKGETVIPEEGAIIGQGNAKIIICGACGVKGHMRTNKECPMYGSKDTANNMSISKKKSYKRSYSKFNSSNANSTKTIHQLITSTRNKAAKAASSSNQNITIMNSTGQQLESQMEGDNMSMQSNDMLQTSQNFDSEGNPIVASNQTAQDEDHLKLFIPKTLISQKSDGNKTKIKMKKSTKDGSSSNLRKNTSHKTPSKSTGTTNKLQEYVMVPEQKMRGNRRRIDPTVALNHQFEEIYRGIVQIAGFRWFLYPVKKRECPNYYDIITEPMDLSQIKTNINKNEYKTREGFIQDIKLIYENCIKYNGDDHEYTTVARHLISYVMEQFCVKERKLMRLERLVNPLMDEDDMVGMKFILEQTVSAMEEVEYSRPFHYPVDRKRYSDYYDKITHPMDLTALRINIKNSRYRSQEEFLRDANLIVSNCALYNGEKNILTSVAIRMIEVAKEKFEENKDTLISLETNLKLQFDEDASDSQMAGSSCITDHLSHIGDDNDSEAPQSATHAITINTAVANQRSSQVSLTLSSGNEGMDSIGEGGLEEEALIQTQRELAPGSNASQYMMDQELCSNSSTSENHASNMIQDVSHNTSNENDTDWNLEPTSAKKLKFDEVDESRDDSANENSVNYALPPVSSSTPSHSNNLNHSVSSNRERLMQDLRLSDSESDGSDDDFRLNYQDDKPESGNNSSNQNTSSENAHQNPQETSNVCFYISDDEDDESSHRDNTET